MYCKYGLHRYTVSTINVAKLVMLVYLSEMNSLVAPLSLYIHAPKEGNIVTEKRSPNSRNLQNKSVGQGLLEIKEFARKRAIRSVFDSQCLEIC